MSKKSLVIMLVGTLLLCTSCNTKNLDNINKRIDSEMEFENSRDFSSYEIELKIRYYSEGLLVEKKCYYLNQKEYKQNQIIQIPSYSPKEYTGLGNYSEGYFLDNHFKKQINIDSLINGEYGRSVNIYTNAFSNHIPDIEYEYQGFSYIYSDNFAFYDFNNNYLKIDSDSLFIFYANGDCYKINYYYLLDEKGIKNGIKINDVSFNGTKINYNEQSLNISITTHFPARRCLYVYFVIDESTDNIFNEYFLQLD